MEINDLGEIIQGLRSHIEERKTFTAIEIAKWVTRTTDPEIKVLVDRYLQDHGWQVYRHTYRSSVSHHNILLPGIHEEGLLWASCRDEPVEHGSNLKPAPVSIYGGYACVDTELHQTAIKDGDQILIIYKPSTDL